MLKKHAVTSKVKKNWTFWKKNMSWAFYKNHSYPAKRYMVPCHVQKKNMPTLPQGPMSIRVWMGLEKHIQDKVRKLSRWYFFCMVYECSSWHGYLHAQDVFWHMTWENLRQISGVPSQNHRQIGTRSGTWIFAGKTMPNHANQLLARCTCPFSTYHKRKLWNAYLNMMNTWACRFCNHSMCPRCISSTFFHWISLCWLYTVKSSCKPKK